MNRLREANIPAPVGGLNTVAPGYALPELDCPLLFNMLGGENGLQVRRGYKEWCTGVGAGVVSTILPFAGSSTNGSKDRLFACAADKVYSVGASSNAPATVLTMASAAGDAGWSVASGIVNSAKDHFLMLCDEQNGYHVYTESTDTWAAVAAGVGATQINGVDPANLVFVTVWKKWVLFVERDTTKIWVGSAVGSLYGTVTAFDLGAQFPNGGSLVGLWSWTGDGGIGIDDHLVAISTSGDVVVYKGTDPTDATKFEIVGQWNVGGVPKGRRIAARLDGDLLILSSLGIVRVSQLTSGRQIQYETDDIAPLFARLVSTYGTIKGWALHVLPEEKALVVTVPQADGQATNQLAMSLKTGGWGQYRDLPIVSAGAWGAPGKLYFGTADGRVCINTDYLDNVDLAASVYTPVQFSGITAFRNNGNARQKLIRIIRPTYIYDGGAPTVQQAARYGYDLTELDPVSSVASTDANAWDTAVWDTAKWGGSTGAQSNPGGAVGMGPAAAIAFRGAATSRTVLVGFDVAWEEGGIL